MRFPLGPTLVVLIVGSAAVPGQDLAAPKLPCGVADPAGRIGFIVGASSKIEAIDLVTGSVLWTSAEARRPLFVHEGRLYALSAEGHCPHIVGLDVENNGACVFESAAFELPDWASAVEGYGRSLNLQFSLDKRILVAAWEARHTREGRKTAGIARIDPSSGKVEAKETSPSPVRTPPRELEKLAVRWQSRPGKDLRALVLEQNGEQQKLVLRAWDAGTPKPPCELLAGRRLMFLPTLDDRFLCLRDGDDTDGHKGSWSVFAAATGEPAGRIPWEPGIQSIALLGPRAYVLVSGPVRGSIQKTFMHARSLKAIDLRTGKTLWERAVESKAVTPSMP